MRSVRRQGDGRTHAWTHASALGAAMSVMRSAVAHTPGEVMCSLRGASSSVAGKSTATVLTLASVVSRRSAEAIGELIRSRRCAPPKWEVGRGEGRSGKIRGEPAVEFASTRRAQSRQWPSLPARCDSNSQVSESRSSGAIRLERAVRPGGAAGNSTSLEVGR